MSVYIRAVGYETRFSINFWSTQQIELNQCRNDYSETLKKNKYFLCCFSLLKIIEHEVNVIFLWPYHSIITFTDDSRRLSKYGQFCDDKSVYIRRLSKLNRSNLC